MTAAEQLQLVSPDGRPAGTATRAACHSDPALLHSVVHVMVRNTAGAVLLQLRGPDRYSAVASTNRSISAWKASGSLNIHCLALK